MTELEKQKIIENLGWLGQNALISKEAIKEVKELLDGMTKDKESKKELPEMMTSKQVMEYLGITRSGLQCYIAQGRVDRVKVSHKKILISKASVMRLIGQE